MAITVGTTARYTGNSAATVTVDAGTDRIFIAAFCQNRVPPSMVTPLLNGAAPSGYAVNTDGTEASSTSLRLRIPYWLEADLPTAGSYSLSWTGLDINLDVYSLNATGVDQSAPESTGSLETATADVRSITLSPRTANSLVFVAGKCNDGTVSVTSGTSISTADTNSWGAYRLDGDTISATVANNAFSLWGGGSFLEAGGAAPTPPFTSVTIS